MDGEEGQAGNGAESLKEYIEDGVGGAKAVSADVLRPRGRGFLHFEVPETDVSDSARVRWEGTTGDTWVVLPVSTESSLSLCSLRLRLLRLLCWWDVAVLDL